MAPVLPLGPFAVPAAAAPPTRRGVALSLGPSVLPCVSQCVVTLLGESYSLAFFFGPGRERPSCAELGRFTPALRPAVAVFLPLASPSAGAEPSPASPFCGVLAVESSTSDLESVVERPDRDGGAVSLGKAERTSGESRNTMSRESLVLALADALEPALDMASDDDLMVMDYVCYRGWCRKEGMRGRWR